VGAVRKSRKLLISQPDGILARHSNSGRHFANDTRLADALEDPAQRAGRE
jgi:hypothetical protein